MRQLAKNKSGSFSISLLIILLLVAAGSSYFIAQAGYKSAVVYIFGMFGVVIALLSITFPRFGFYFSLIFSFFVFDIVRLLDVDVPLVSLTDGLVFLTFIGVLVHKIIKKEPFWKNCRSPILFLYLVVLIYFLIEFFNPNGGVLELFFLMLRRFMTLMLFLYCAIQLFTDVKSIHQFFKIWIILSLITALYACYQQWVGMPQFELNSIMSNPLAQKLSLLDNGDFRKSSFLSDCTAFGLLMSATAPILLIFALNLKVKLNFRLFLIANAVIIAIAMSYSGTRTATIILTVNIILYILMTLSNLKTLIFCCFFAAFFAFLLYAPIYGNVTINRLRSSFQFSHDQSLKVRDKNRHDIQPYIHSHPIGGGVATTGLENIKFNVGHPLAGFPTDSGLLRIALEYGWIGLIIQCLTYFIILQQGVRAYYRSKNPHYKTLLLASTVGIFGYVVAQYSQVAIGQIPGAFLFFGLIAIIIRLRQMELATLSATSSKNKVI